MNEHLDQDISIDSRRGVTTHEHHLILVRAIWWIVALLVFGFIAVGVPNRYAQLTTISPGANTLVGQLRPDEAFALEQAGIPVTFYAVYFTALYTLFTLLFASTGLALAWLRPKDRVALLISVSLIGMGLTAITVGMTQPRWHPAFIAVRAVWYASSIPALYLFPDGRFVPRWTRWLTAIWLIYTIAWLIFPAISPPFGFGQGFTGSELPRNLWLLLWICSGLAAQIYRYRHVSNAMERQQIKWVEFGFGSFVILWIIGISTITLTQLAPMGGTIMIAKLAGTSIVLLGELIAPLSLGASILRYQLFDIDILINRSLVYGALTASVVALYVLIVGGFGLLFQMQNNLPGIIITILLIAFLFQPLHRRLQGIANRFVPVPQYTLPSVQPEDKLTIPKGEGSMLRRNRAALVILAIALLFLTLGNTFVLMRLITPYDDARLQPGVQGIWHSNGVVISPLNQQTNGLQKGDLVVAVNGRSLESFAQALFDPSATRPQWNNDQTLIYTVVRDGRTLDVAVKPTRYPFLAILAEEWGTLVFAISILLTAGFVFFKRPEESTARVLFLGAAGMASARTWSFGLQVSDIVGAVGWWLYIATTTVGYSMAFITMLHLALVFPQPRPIILRWRWLIPVIYVAPYTFLLATMIVERATAVSTLQWLATAGSATGLIQLVCVILAIIIHARNYRSLHDPISRRQLRWVLFAVSVAGITGIVFGVIPEFVTGHALLSWNVLALFAVPIPLALAFAILRYRLFDIDVIINRTLVYGALTTIVIGIYVLVVGYLGVLFHTGNNLTISLLATGLVAVVFQPLRQRLQRGINRLMYGERDDPYAALTRLGRRLEASLVPEAVLPTVVTTVREVLKLPYVAIYLHQNSHGYKIVAESASPSLRAEGGKIRVPGMESEGLCIPLIHQGDTLGYIVLGPRAPNEAFSPTDLRLLEDLAPQVGVAVHAVRLTADLQRSREQLVLAREEERRRLRRDLHDGLGPQLAGLTLKLETARNRLAYDPVADSLLADLAKRTQEATADIRRLVYELRPPTLDELGLVSALREGATQYTQQGYNGLNITFDVPESLPPLPAAVEVAVYRITQEALTNVIRHAEAHTCFVRLSMDEPAGLLCLEVQDDGKGLSMKRRAGVGLSSMRERAEELGGTLTIESIPTGGTRILVRLPYRLLDDPVSPYPQE